MTDILERAKAAIAEAQSCGHTRYEELSSNALDELLPDAITEVERLRSVISEPVKSFGTMELVSWVNQLQKTISEYPDAEWGNWPFVLMMGVHCENFSKRWHSPTIELMAARIKELEAEVEAKQANNEYLQKMTEEAQGIMQESQLLLCKEANEAEQLQNEVERLRSLNESLMENGNDLRTRCQKAEARIKELQDLIDKPPEEADWVADYHLLQSALDGPIIDAARKWHAAYRKAQNSNLMRAKEVERLRAENRELKKTDVWANDVIKEHESLNARIKELEALNELNHKNMRSWLDTTTDKEFLDKLSSEIGFKDAYIERLEAAFLEATKEIVYSTHEGRDAPEGEDAYAEKVAREAQERIKAGGKDEA